MASYNRVILIGNVTREIDLRYTPAGTAVCDIGLAVNDRRKGQNGEWIDEATFVDCTAFGRTAEVAGEYLSKGAPVMLEGRLKLDQWEDKNSGDKRSKLKVIVDRLQLLGGKRDGDGPQRTNGGRQQSHDEPTYSHDAAQSGGRSGSQSGSQSGGHADDDLPF